MKLRIKNKKIDSPDPIVKFELEQTDDNPDVEINVILPDGTTESIGFFTVENAKDQKKRRLLFICIP